MFPYLALVPENNVTDSFNMMIEEYPQSAMGVANYFEIKYIGRKLPNNTRRTPPFPVVWNMYKRIIDRQACTSSSVEGWHNAFGSPNITKTFEAGTITSECSLLEMGRMRRQRNSQAVPKRKERIFTIVANDSNRNLD